MCTGGDSPDGEPSITLEDLSDSLDLDLETSPLIGGKPCERLHGHLNLAAGASLVPNAGDDAIDEQDRVVAWLAGRREGACGGLAREQPGSRLAADRVRIEVGEQ
jgi:hypothetical protein